MDVILKGADTVLHLAARNDHQLSTRSEFLRDNVDLTLRIAQEARRQGVSRFVFATSSKVLTSRGGDYRLSKATAERKLMQLDSSDLRISLARLSPVYGEGSQGKLRFLNHSPLWLRKITSATLRPFTAIVSADRVADGMIELIESPDPFEEVCFADPLGRFSIYHLFVFLLNWLAVIAAPLVLGLFCLIAAFAIAMTSRGGVFFIQDRVGKKIRPFRLWKFRTMESNTPTAGTHEISKSYVTRVGGFLRKTKIDEIPQAVNLVKAELNFVGPRPCLERQHELIEERQRYGVFAIKPGITGYAQVAGVDMSEPRRLAIYDHRYFVLRGILMDLQIVLRTAIGGGFGDRIDRGSSEQK